MLFGLGKSSESRQNASQRHAIPRLCRIKPDRTVELYGGGGKITELSKSVTIVAPQCRGIRLQQDGSFKLLRGELGLPHLHEHLCKILSCFHEFWLQLHCPCIVLNGFS